MRRDNLHVRSRGLPSHRGLNRKWGIMTKAIRNPLMVRGAGERSAKSSLTSPVCPLPDCAPLWRAFVHLAYQYSKKCTQFPVTPEMVRVRVQKRACPALTPHLAV